MTDLVGEEKKSEAVFCPSPFLSFFTYSPIHLFSTSHTKSKQYQSSVLLHIRSSLVHASHSLEVSPLLLSGNKTKNQEHFIAPS
jgi:hypothetical protein